LAFGGEDLDDLNEWFRNWAGGADVAVRAYYETDKTKGISVVDKLSANPHVHGCAATALPSNHIDMCKPTTREAQIYQSVSAMVRELLPATPTATGSVRELPLALPIAIASTSRAVVPTGLLPNIPNPWGMLTNGTVDAMVFDTLGLEPEILIDFQNFTTTAPDDRRALSEKLTSAGRDYQVRDAERKKERFSMALQRHIAQPAALTKYTRLMADLEARFNRHALHAISSGQSISAIDRIVQHDVIDPVILTYSEKDPATSASTIDAALYYLTGNCHLRWDNDKD
jgi:hypothetical protein